MEISFEEFLSWWLKHEAVSKGKARRRWRAAGTAVLSSFAVANREEAKKHRRQDQVHSSSESDDDVDGGGPGPGPDDDAENHGMGEGGNVGKQVASRIAGVEQLVLSATQKIDHVDNKVAQLDETIAQLQQTLGSKMDSIMAVFLQQAGGGDQVLLPSPLAANLDTEDPGAMHGVAQIDGALARQSQRVSVSLDRREEAPQSKPTHSSVSTSAPAPASAPPVTSASVGSSALAHGRLAAAARTVRLGNQAAKDFEELV